jgi:hypothetical protein
MPFVILTLLVAAGAYFLYKERELIWLGLRSYSWPSTQGTIADTSDQSFVTTGLTGSAATGVGDVQWRETAYGYVYTVRGRSYHSATYCFGGWSERIVASYRIGESVKVYFDPEDPHRSVLRRGVTFGALFGAVLLIIACVYAIWLFKS